MSDHVFVRGEHVCPWWLCFTFDNLLRRFFQNPEETVKPYVREGDTVLDVGPGMGYFSIPLAKLVGAKGRVFAADVQSGMLRALQKRARRAGVEQRITLHLCQGDSIGLDTKFDFILAFWMAHEVPGQESFFKEIRSLLTPAGRFLLSEPLIHVTRAKYDQTVETAIRAGFTLEESPKIFLSRSALFAGRGP